MVRKSGARSGGTRGGRGATVSLESKLRAQAEAIRALRKALAVRERREAVVFAALGLRPEARAGERGDLGALTAWILKTDERMALYEERLKNAMDLVTLLRRQSAELEKRLGVEAVRERIRIELDLMKNTTMVLALAGIEMDEALVREIDTLRKGVVQDSDLAALKRSKETLDKRFAEEIKRYDLQAIYARKDVPGYR